MYICHPYLYRTECKPQLTWELTHVIEEKPVRVDANIFGVPHVNEQGTPLLDNELILGHTVSEI